MSKIAHLVCGRVEMPTHHAFRGPTVHSIGVSVSRILCTVLTWARVHGSMPSSPFSAGIGTCRSFFDLTQSLVSIADVTENVVEETSQGSALLSLPCNLKVLLKHLVFKQRAALFFLLSWSSLQISGLLFVWCVLHCPLSFLALGKWWTGFLIGNWVSGVN